MIDRKRDLSRRSAEYRFIIRRLTDPAYTREEAGGIIEDYMPMYWDLTCRDRAELNGPHLAHRALNAATHSQRHRPHR
ncbi:hypothetical protein [Bradyrhizobium sp. SZCCHNR1075]|uniref:hypothetical protein n=1 Tax=Bradyrhizobium sp. SZCCHNR1075 TaxID=3057362 RepID=UPI0028EE4E4E|nr:hypothetical protein [Bradyrhizobium sp. SZCCHNR1075]